MAAIQRYLKQTYGHRCWQVKTHGNGYQRAGLPDLIVCVDGRLFGFEVKKPGEVARPIQQFELARMTDAGATTAVVHSIDEVAAVLQQAAA